MDLSHEPHRAVLTDFLDAIVEDRDPVISGEEALASQRIIYDILRRGGWSSRRGDCPPSVRTPR